MYDVDKVVGLIAGENVFGLSSARSAARRGELRADR
jgi:hypothetical protein